MQEIKAAISTAWLAHKPEHGLRYVGDGSSFWRKVVAQSLLCADDALFQSIFKHFEKPATWRVADGAHSFLMAARARGYKTAVVSNFDTRLRFLLGALALESHFDAIVISAEVGCEKPDARIFVHAADRLGISLKECVHIGDDATADVEGARGAGAQALLFGAGGDVSSFGELEELLCR